MYRKITVKLITSVYNFEYCIRISSGLRLWITT